MSHSVEGFNNEEFTIWCSPRWIFSKVSSTVIFITCCNILQHTETHCNTLQHTAGHCNKSTLQWFSLPAATHGNTLQHTATHCNTLQHTATSQLYSDFHYWIEWQSWPCRTCSVAYFLCLILKSMMRLCWLFGTSRLILK